MQKQVMFGGLILSALIGLSSCSKAPTYKDKNASPYDRAVSIVSEMTLEEKVSLMRHEAAELPRLGIKQYNWWNEALHGVGRAGAATVFPQPIGMAASFDDRLLFDVFTAVSDEARAKNQEAKAQGPLNIYQGLTFWTPNVNIYRDPRWGRGHETYGEDPYLTGVMGVSVVRGLQGDNFEGGAYEGDNAEKYYKLHACAKHYAVHSGPEWSRHVYDANDVSPRDLYETYLPAFKDLVQKGGVKEVMCAYNRFEGEPCCGSNRLLQQILRNEWGYKGIVLSDCWAISDFYKEGFHHTDPDAEHAVAKAVYNGTDLECGDSYTSLVEAVNQGLLSEEDLDRSIIRLMEARYQLGEMDADEDVKWTKIPMSVVESKEHLDLNKKMTLESMVLLKNNGILPLYNNLKIALIGPNANDSVMQWGNYNGFPTKTITLLEALQARLPEAQITFVDGLDHTSDVAITSLMNETVAPSGKAGLDAQYWNNQVKSFQTNPSELKDPDVDFHYNTAINLTTAGATVFAPGVDLGRFVGIYTTKFLPKKSENIVFSIKSMGYVVLFVNGEQVFRGGNMKLNHAYAMNVEAGKEYDIRLLYLATEGDCASVSFDFGREVPLDLNKVVNQVKDADVVIYAGGLSPMLEGEEMPVQIPGFHGGDRDIIELPAVQTTLLSQLKKAGKKIVYINFSGSAVALDKESQMADAVLQAWYPGQKGGEAIADVLYGDYNPAGRLPITFYKSTADLPDIEDYHMANRTYRYFKGEALYPFGFGLSYTTFNYGPAEIKENGENFELTIPVTNNGKLDGDEVVQVYVSRPSDTEGPSHQLRAFKRVNIKAGETAQVAITLTKEAFNWFDPATNNVHPLAGEYDVLYGPSSDKKSLKMVQVTVK